SLSPVTNTMPVLRHKLLNGKESKHLCMVWVSVPELSISRSEQTYSFIERNDERTVVQYASENGYTADITFDTDGTVIDYPGLAARI
ncbi:putative glycolipid-binding domain-containing protein, partial [Acinetobacter baumannii]